MAGISQRPSWAEVHKSHRPQWEAGIKSLLSLAGDPPAYQPSEMFPFPRFGCVFPGLDVFSQPCRAAQRELKKNMLCRKPCCAPLCHHQPCSHHGFARPELGAGTKLCIQWSFSRFIPPQRRSRVSK